MELLEILLEHISVIMPERKPGDWWRRNVSGFYRIDTWRRLRYLQRCALLGLPRAYRDLSDGARKNIPACSRAEVYRLRHTDHEFNMFFQLSAKRRFRPLEAAEEILFMPDLLLPVDG